MAAWKYNQKQDVARSSCCEFRLPPRNGDAGIFRRQSTQTRKGLRDEVACQDCCVSAAVAADGAAFTRPIMPRLSLWRRRSRAAPPAQRRRRQICHRTLRPPVPPSPNEHHTRRSSRSRPKQPGRPVSKPAPTQHRKWPP